MEQNEKKLEPIFSVSEYIEFLNINLRKIGVAKIMGEITKFTISTNGHVYFSIKDKSGAGVLECIIWKNNYALCGVKLEEGIEVILSGYPDVYPQTGRLSFKAQTIELKGEGALKKAYEELKNKLEKEGSFAEERKKKIPAFPERIGIITSKQGAVIHDFLSNIGKHGFRIQMIDSRVEGQEAIKDLLSAIRTFRQKDIDVLVVIKGGGSLESMMPFNNELLVREIANFPTPVLVGIGHDKDEPLATMAADVAVSTPTAAANVLNESWNQALFLVEKNEVFIFSAFEDSLNGANSIINDSISSFKNALTNVKISLKHLLNNILDNFEGMIEKVGHLIESCEETVKNNNPERQLKLGYSIASISEKIVRKIGDVKTGQDMDVRVVNGLISSKVKNIKKHGKKDNR